MRCDGPSPGGGPARPGRVRGSTYSGSVSRADETLLDLALSRATVDRSARERADDATVAQALEDPRTRVLVIRDGRSRAAAGDPASLDLRAPAPGDAARSPWFLGRHDGVAYLAVDETPSASVSSTSS